MKLTGEIKFFAGVIILTLVILSGAVMYFARPAKEVALETLIPENVLGIGAEQPEVTLVEFSDYECAACKAIQPVINQLLEKYPDQLRIIYRHFPLDQHENAQLAAQAAEAAGAQGKFSQMHDLLYENQAGLSAEIINGLAIELGLDMDQFSQDINQGKYKDKIQQDISDALKLGINSTPTLFLNGKMVNLNSFNDLTTEVEKALNG